MKGDEEEASRKREEEVCKISVDDTYEGVSGEGSFSKNVLNDPGGFGGL